MIRKLDLKLYKALIKSEFFLDTYNKEFVSSGHSKLLMIDIIQQLKGLKQFIRFINLYKTRHIKEIVILVNNNKFLFHFIRNYFKKFSLYRIVNVQSYISNKIKPLKSNNSRMIIEIGSGSKNCKLLKKLFYLNFLLVQTFSRERSFQFSYHIPVNIAELKKLLFILIIITNILKKKYTHAMAK